MQLAKFDVQGTLAHIEMLQQVGLLTEDEFLKLSNELNRILLEVIEPQLFEIEDGVEDVHSQIELMLVRSLGDIGKKCMPVARETIRFWLILNYFCAPSFLRLFLW